MDAFYRTRLGSAILGAIGITIGVALSGVLGLSEPTTASYVSSAIAGFVGGYVGRALYERRQSG